MATQAAAPPSERELAAALAAAAPVWAELVRTLEERHAPVSREWKPSKRPFGRMLLLKRKDRTLIYLAPQDGRFDASVVLGDKAAAAALASGLPEAIKQTIRDARRYAEGRGIVWEVTGTQDAQIALDLVGFKMSAQ
jgi:uncharacterized protein DUF3788